MHKPLLDLYTLAQMTHTQLYNQMKDVLKTVKDADINELAEIAFICKKSSELLDDMRKQLNKHLSTLEIIICKQWAMQEEPVDISTEYMHALPKLKIITTLPSDKTNPLAYEKLLRSLRIPEHCWPLIRLHWPSFCEYMTELTEQGEPLPEGLDAQKTAPAYSLQFYQRKALVAGDTKLEDIPF